jgi:ribosome-interacting GTPase 1
MKNIQEIEKMIEHPEKDGQQHKPKLGQTLVSKGYITEEELDKALSEQKIRLGEILIRSDRITADQLHLALDHQKKESIKIGEICKKMGYVTSEDLNWALNRMKRRLGEILIEIGALEVVELQHALDLQKNFSQDT